MDYGYWIDDDTVLFHISLSLLKLLILFSERSEKKTFTIIFIISWADSLYIISKLIPYKMIFSAIYNMPAPMSIYLLIKTYPETYGDIY